jgi:ADP-dependent NAD(P)H-hydrate dehydratase / NAD(P)H-hydrate epimerase
MKVVTAAEMREIDRKTIRECGISGIVLMERAGLAVTGRIKELFGRRNVVVVCGKGNNGGDGLVIARILHNEGWEAGVVITSKPVDFKGDALSQYKTAVACGVKIFSAESLLSRPSSILTRHSIIVDAVLGTGMQKNISGRLADVIELINRSGLPIVSVDIPTGISSDTGQVMGIAVRAAYTVTFGLPKRGHMFYPGAEYSGTLSTADIGFPRRLLTSESLPVELLEKDDISAMIPRRNAYSHKGDYGHVLMVAGSRGKTGAALMAARACLRAGAGLVTIGVPESLAPVFQSRVTEEMVLGLPDRGDGTLSAKAAATILDFLTNRADILAIGPGIGVSADCRRLMETLIKSSRSPMVIDADGVNVIQRKRGVLLQAKTGIILTPHPGEMARLLQGKGHDVRGMGQGAGSKEQKGTAISIQDIEKDRISIAIHFAKETGTHLVLKGVPTIVGTEDGRAYINRTGNPGMATAGTGDVLTGMIAGLLGRTRDQLAACLAGVYLHGLSGDIAASEKGHEALVATDIIDAIPSAFLSLQPRNA